MRFSYITRVQINEIPKTPGVYVFLKGKNILYIGKAANLRDRVRSHFAQPSYRDNLFMSQVTKAGYFETQSEIDALLLESQLIKKNQPKYNVMWKDDKKYFYVAITKEKLPRVFLTHQPVSLPVSLPRASLKLALGKVQGKAQNTKAEYIGPFVEGRDIKRVLQLLRKAFPYYTHSTNSGQAAKKHPILPCPYCHIGLCPGPKPDVKAYKRNIKHLVSVLKGQRISVLKNLKKSMKRASKEQDFEKAAVLRDQIFSLENIAKHSIFLSLPWQSYEDTQKTLQKLFNAQKITRIEAYDISNIQGKQSTGSMVTFLNGKPAKEWYRKFKIHITGKPNDFAMMEELISRRLKHTEWPYPNLMLIDGGKGQLSSTLKAISNLPRASYPPRTIRGIVRGPHLDRVKLQKIKVVALAKRNNELFSPKNPKPVLLKNLPQGVSNLFLYIRDEAHRFAISYHRKLRRVDALKSS
ncbi:MAG: UvrB/UvrC motif-containing protein [Candidatus Wildermuthbacteria bacterium]|nr:UvrB/UvrC motif-containing protein [Candidatus Wildermuthbacteria bacterium]